MSTVATDITGMTVVDDGILWSVVRRSPLTTLDRRKQNAISIMAISEDKTRIIGKYEIKLNVRFSFYLLIGKDDEADTELTETMRHLHKKIHAQVEPGGVLDGIAWNVEELNNDLIVENSTDRQIEGEVTYAYSYRHKLGDQELVR
jgi:hypothetical protein